LVFLDVVESGSFTKAADKLNIPKANLSRKVSRLEQDLGVTLLERTTRSQNLTEQGKLFIEHCRKIKSEIDLARSNIAQSMTEISGPLKVGTSVGVAHEILKDKVFKFLNGHPDLSLDMVLTNKRVDLVSEGYDILVRIGKLEDSSLVAKKLGTIKRKLFCHPDLEKEFGKITSLKQLESIRLLLMGSIHKDQEVKLYKKSREGKFTANKSLFIDDFSLLKQAAVDGLGVAILPSYMCKEELRKKKLVNILPQWEMPPVDVYAIYPRYRSKIKKVRLFLDFLDEVFSEKLTY
jgi:LysR family transcriptional regulator AphB